MSFIRSIAAVSLAMTAFTSVAQAKELVVYSSRQEHLIKPVFELYTEKTGIKINYITDSEAPLMARLRAEGANTPASGPACHCVQGPLSTPPSALILPS